MKRQRHTLAWPAGCTMMSVLLLVRSVCLAADPPQKPSPPAPKPQVLTNQQMQLLLDQVDSRQQFGPPARIGPSPSELANVEVDPQLRALVSDLDDPDYAKREAASRTLAETALDKLQVYVLLGEQGLTAEQRYRLVQALRRTLLKTPRGAIGIRMQPPVMMNNGPMEVRVMELLPGLPAEKVLQIGDRIVQVDGQPLRFYDDLQFRVQNKKPGEKVSLTLRRPRTDAEGKVLLDERQEVMLDDLQIEVELGSADLLNNDPRQFPQRSRVELDREYEAAAVARAGAPPMQPIEVRGGAGAITASASVEEEVDPMVDRFPAVQDLLKQRQLIARGDMKETALLRDYWESQLHTLLTSAQDARLNPQQREYMQRVVERYARLMEIH